MSVFKKIFSSTAIFVVATTAWGKPNNPPECDPNSPEFAAAANGSVVIVVPNADFAELGYVLQGCERAKQIHMGSGFNSHNCVVIRSGDFGTAASVIENEQVPIQGVFSHFQFTNPSDLSDMSSQIYGSAILKAQPWDNSTLSDPSALQEYGYTGYNMLKAVNQ